MLVCCKPAEVMLEDGTDSSSQIETQVGEPEVPREPVGVIAAEDCQQINMGDKACDFRLTHQNGEVWSLYDYEGDIVLLDFSTVWCPPCQAAGHSTQPLQDAYSAEGVRIVTILIDGAQNGVEPSEEEINTWVSGHNITTAPVLRGSRDKMMDPSGKKEIGFIYGEKSKIGKETLIWLDDEHHTPMGVIIKKTRG